MSYTLLRRSMRKVSGDFEVTGDISLTGDSIISSDTGNITLRVSEGQQVDLHNQGGGGVHSALLTRGRNDSAVQLTGGGSNANGGNIFLSGSARSSVASELWLRIGSTVRVKLDGTGIGFFGVTPVAQPSAYTPTNVSADRAYDANSTTLAEVADVLGTLISDLQGLGLVG